VNAPRFEGNAPSSGPVSKYIDHTKLTYKAEENPDNAIAALCGEAKDNGFYAVCVRPDKIGLAKENLKGSDVKVATVIGFPAGKVTLANERANPTVGDVPLAAKLTEAEKSVANGADELDLVMNVRQFLSEAGQPTQVATLHEFSAIKAIAGNRPVKVILETDLLSPMEIETATRVCVQAKVDLVKTSTGMVDGGVGATVANVERIRNVLVSQGVADTIGIKASGGIKTQADAQALIAAGATRLGTSQGVAIVSGQAAKPNVY
jgi:deoxyribose-phosphate aldolase